VLTNPLVYMQRDPLFIVGTATGDDTASPLQNLIDKSEFDRILDDKKQSCDEVLSGGAPGRTILIRGEGVRNCRSFERINFSASPGRFFGYFLVDTRK